jgi:hypothetical protein
LLKRDLLFIIERLTSVMDEGRIETLARQHGIRQKRDDGGVKKAQTAFVRRADESTLSRLLVESSVLLAASRGNPSAVLKVAASTYKVDTDAITSKVRQEFAAKKRNCLACEVDGTRRSPHFSPSKSGRENTCRFLSAPSFRLAAAPLAGCAGGQILVWAMRRAAILSSCIG